MQNTPRISPQSLHALYVYAASLRKNGYTERTIRHRLEQKGLDKERAVQVARDVQRGLIRSTWELEGSAALYYGISAAVIGLLMLVGLLNNGSSAHPETLVALAGMLILGVALSWRGLRARQRMQ